MLEKIITAEEISAAVAELCVKANRRLPPDVLRGLEESLAREHNPGAREILGQLLQNAALAGEKDLPLCQDTGLAVFFVELGQEARLRGDLYAAINEGVRRGYGRGFLRKSSCDPFTRENSGDNTPAIIHLELVPGSNLRICFLAKGGGSENMSRVTMLAPAQGWPGIKDFVLGRVRAAGGNPCPPLLIGLGIGGTFERAALLAKKALLRPLDEPNPEPDLREKERELLELVNGLGVGPMGLGGRATCLGLHILKANCHIASLPLAVNIQCHSARHAAVLL
ncbi:MAG: fumarate hydratase [Deltaproteobacteria bacterium]|nr:fumarate hydratase [Deltaproteobacteria bacterium]